MKKILLTSLGALLIVGGAEASVRPYASLKWGYINLMTNETEEGTPSVRWDRIRGFTAAVAGGAAFEASDMLTLRGELEYGYAYVTGKVYSGLPYDMKIRDHTFLLGGFTDFGGDKWGGFNPYVGLHIGYGFGRLNFNHPSRPNMDVNGFIYGASVGVSYALNNNLAADLGFRYLFSDRSYDEQGLKGELENRQWSFLLGLRYKF